MKKVTIFFLAVVGIITLGTVSSCKDYDDDSYNDLRAQQVSMDDALRKLIEAQKADLMAKINAIKSCECDTAAIGQKIRDLQAALNNKVNKDDFENSLNNKVDKDDFENSLNNKVDKTVFEDSIKKLSTQYADLATEIELLKSTAASLEKAYKTADSILNLRIDSVNTYVLRLQDSISDINGRLKVLEGYDESIKANLDSINALNNSINVLKNNYNNLRDSISVVTAKANANDEWIKAMKQLYGDSLEKLSGLSAETIATLRSEADSLYKRANKLSQEYADSINNNLKITLNTRIDSVCIAYAKADSILQSQIDTLKTDVSKIKGRLDIVEGQIEQLKGVVDNLINRLNSQITSIIVQSITTPLLLDANIALPVGLQTNVVCAYTGSVKNGDVTFPTSSKAFNLADASERFTNAEMNDINEVDLPQGTPLISTGGKLYLTINPSDVNFTGAGLKLVNSQNAESGFRIVNVQKSDNLIKFASRADNGNGFYEADFELFDADETALNTAPLKDAAKKVYDVLKNRTGVREMVKSVVKAAYKTASLPAYAVQAPYTWKDATTGELKTSYVHSNYNIAATSVHPLSYNLESALEDLGVSTKIPHKTIHHIAYLKDLFANALDKVHSKLYFEFDKVDPISVDLTVNFGSLDFSELTLTGTATATATYDKPTAVDPSTGAVTSYTTETLTVIVNNIEVNGTELQQIANAIQTQIINKLNSELALKGAKISTDIAKSVNDALVKTANQINTSVDDVINIINSYLGKTNNYVDRLNNLIDKINSVLNSVYARVDNINYYLQPLLLYGDGKDSKFHHLGSYATSTCYVTPGKLVLYPTSYTAEILNPAAKKYVTVTKALKLNADGTVGANDPAEVKRANASGIIDGKQQFYFNEVIPGTIRSVAVDVKSGYAYEFAYAALDYAGYQTVQRYWIRVK